MAAALPQRPGQPAQLRAGQQRAGRVGRRGHQGADAVLVPMPGDQLRSQLIAHLGADRHELRGPFDQAQEMPVARVARIGQQPVLARVDQQTGGQ
ncbi:hypothetical protein FQZ97_1267140 [compost metagenome]